MVSTLGLIGFNKSSWQSVNRTLNFYSDALSKNYNLVNIDPNDTEWINHNFDGVINVNSPIGWQIPQHPSFPIFYIMNGGAILNQEFLYSKLENLDNLDTLVVNCTSDITILKKMFDGIQPNILHLPLPVNTHIFKPLDKEKCRQQLPIKRYDYIIGYVGRLLPQKNLHRFLEIVALLKKKLYPKTIAGIVNGKFWGDHPVLPYVSKEYQHKIQNLVHQLDIKKDIYYFPGVLGDNELAIFYNCMDLLIHPTHSLDENFGYVAIEAMACGVPVIGTAYGGLKDTIVSGETGILIPTWVTQAGIRSNFYDCAEKVSLLLQNCSRLMRMKKATIHRVENNYSVDHCSKVLVTGIEQVIQLKKNQASKPLKVRKQTSYPIFEPFLPQVEKRWEHYYNVVADYVSIEQAHIHDDAFIHLAAPVAKLENNNYEMLDDAWPAKYQLTDEIRIIVEKYKGKIAVKDLSKEDILLPSIQKMIEIGLVVYS